MAIPDVNKVMMSFKGQASWAKITSTGGKLTGLSSHSTKKLTKQSNQPISLKTLMPLYMRIDKNVPLSIIMSIVLWITIPPFAKIV